MDKKRSIIVIFLLLIISINIIPIKSKSVNTEDVISNANFQSTKAEQSKKIDKIDNFNPISESSEEKWNVADNSSIESNFKLSDSSNESTQNFSLDNCDDWSLNNNFSFSDIRSEKITNGDAETTDELWTDYLPPHYEGNVSRESSFPSGSAISGNYSWYFNLTTSDHAVIIGFDDPINVSSDSVIFSFSYSLLRNNLGTSYDSNICIRLFFQFDIYIFFWFNGNIGVLSNVTGPGGYADLLVDDATFDGSNHNYSLNVTALGLELFDQKPDQLRSFAVQTWGELSAYEMEFVLDDISLTDQIDPTTINLNVNSNTVLGDVGKGFVIFTESLKSEINYFIDYSYSDRIYFDYLYDIKGMNKIRSQRNCNFIDWDVVKWNESTNQTVILPTIINEMTIDKIILQDWTVNSVLVDGFSQSYQVEIINGTHKKIKFLVNSYNLIEYSFYSNNLMNNIILSNYQISHNENLTVSIESNIYNEELFLYILDSENEVYFVGSTFTDIQGDALITNIQLDSKIPRNTHSMYVYWSSLDYVGLGRRDFEVTTYPTTIIPHDLTIIANYKQDFHLEVDYINTEISDYVDFATVEYSWIFGSGLLQQNIGKHYFIDVTNTQANPGIYYLNVTGSKNGYATSGITVELEVIFSDYNLTLLTPENALPGTFLTLHSQVTNNFSLPASNVEIRFDVNDVPFSDTWTNDTGFAEVTYPVSPIYSYSTINVTCSIIIDETAHLTRNSTIDIAISELPQAAQLNSIIQNINKNTNETYFFNYTITYPVFGKNWFVNIPAGMNVANAKIITEFSIIPAIIIENAITWEREINSTLTKDDVLELEVFKPQLSLTPLLQNNRLTIDILITSNNLPYQNLEINITQDVQWEAFDQWNLYYNGELITEKSNLAVTLSDITFYINTTQQDTIVSYQLEGMKSNFIQISPTTVILGAGTLILTIISTILLLKKKSNVSLDIQV